MYAVYIGKNPPGSSMYLVGKQIADLGGAVLCTSIGEQMKGCEKVITLVPEDVPKLEQARRFIGVGEVIVFLAANWEEYSLWERGSMLAYATEHPMVVHSPHSYSEVSKTFKSLLSPAKQKALGQNLKYIPYGISDEFSPTRRDPLKWIVPYNRVNQGQKNLSAHREITEKFKIMMRGKTEHRFIVIGAAGFEKDADLSAYEVVQQPDTREGYLQLIADRGAFLCTSNYESFGIYYLELLCSGIVGVFLDKPWIRGLLPDYPLIAENQAQAVALMKDVTENYDKWYAIITEQWIPFIRQTYDLKRFATSIVTI